MSNSQGSALNIVKLRSGTRMLELSLVELHSVLLQSDVRDREVVVVSIVGALRKGKSFLLGFFLRYLYAKYNRSNLDDWMGRVDEPLRGFSWRAGSEPVTSGICLWSEVFLHDYDDGRQVAILLMDTQGIFDSNSNVQDCARIFALSTLLSSIQIYNIFHNIQEDDLQHLRFFTEYGQITREDGDETPFQKLMFLIRDWSYPFEAEFGIEGGQQILERRLAMNTNQPLENQELRRHLRRCFHDISCYLMPRPGFQVESTPNFDGSLQDIEPEFKNHLQTLIPLVLAPENLVVKEINAQKVKAHELAQYFEAYVNVFHDGTMPETKDFFNATAEQNNENALEAAKNKYEEHMNQHYSPEAAYMSNKELLRVHKHAFNIAERHFTSIRKMGGKELSRVYYQKLVDFTNNTFTVYRQNNEQKKQKFFNFINACLSLGGLVLSVGFVLVGAAEVSVLALGCTAVVTLFGWFNIWIWKPSISTVKALRTVPTGIQSVDTNKTLLTQAISVCRAHFSKIFPRNYHFNQRKKRYVVLVVITVLFFGAICTDSIENAIASILHYIRKNGRNK